MEIQSKINNSKFMEMVNNKLNELFVKMLNAHLSNFTSIIMNELDNIKSENDIISLWNKNCSEPVLNISNKKEKENKENKENTKCCFILNKGKNKGNECGRK